MKQRRAFAAFLYDLFIEEMAPFKSSLLKFPRSLGVNTPSSVRKTVLALWLMPVRPRMCKDATSLSIKSAIVKNLVWKKVNENVRHSASLIWRRTIFREHWSLLFTLFYRRMTWRKHWSLSHRENFPPPIRPLWSLSAPHIMGCANCSCHHMRWWYSRICLVRGST